MVTYKEGMSLADALDLAVAEHGGETPLAKVVGTSQPQIHRWRTGSVPKSSRDRERLRDVLGFSEAQMAQAIYAQRGNGARLQTLENAVADLRRELAELRDLVAPPESPQPETGTRRRRPRSDRGAP